MGLLVGYNMGRCGETTGLERRLPSICKSMMACDLNRPAEHEMPLTLFVVQKSSTVHSSGQCSDIA